MQQPAEKTTTAPRLLLSIEEAATALGIGRVQIYRLSQRKAIKTVSIGRRRLVVLASLEEYVARLEAEGGGGHGP